MRKLFGIISAALFAAVMATAGISPARSATVPAGAITGIERNAGVAAESVRYHRRHYAPRRHYGGPRFYRGPVWRGPVYRGPFFHRPIYRGPAYYPYGYYRRCWNVRRWVPTPFGYQRRWVRVCR